MDPAPDATSDTEKELEAVLAACFTRGTSQTILLLGMNSYRQSERLKAMSAAHQNVIALSITSSLFPEEGPAIELLTRQLALALRVDLPSKLQEGFGFFWESLSPGHNLLLTICEAENYAHKNQQQRLLYSLLELVTAAPCGLLLVLQSTRLDFTELLEKRLKSRLNAKPFCCMQDSFAVFKQEVVSEVGDLPEAWKPCFAELLESTDFQHYYALGKTAGWVKYVMRRAQVEDIRIQDPRRSLEAVLREESAGLTLTFLKELPQYEIAVLLAHALTEKTMGFSKLDLAFSTLKREAKNGIVNHSRRSFFRISSRLIALGLLEKQHKHLSDELSIVRLQVEAEELFSLILSGTVRGFTLFGAWIRSV